MNTQVQRLEELLERVQKNRDIPRSAMKQESPAEADMAISEPIPQSTLSELTPEKVLSKEKERKFRQTTKEPFFQKPEAPKAEELPPEPANTTSTTLTPAKKPGTPLQAAVEDHMVDTKVEAEEPKPVPATPEAAKPIVIEASDMMVQVKSVALKVSDQPKIEPDTFGRLLHRTLALRLR